LFIVLKNYFFNNIAFGQFRFAEFLPAGRQDYRFATRQNGEKKKIGCFAFSKPQASLSEPNFAGTGISF